MSHLKSFVIDLLSKMGVWDCGLRKSCYSDFGDDGIDGIIMEDKWVPLIYMQAKKWQRTELSG